MSKLRPRPHVDSDNDFFWAGTQQGRLLLQQCSSCQALRHPPGPLCRACRSSDWTIVQASGRGTVYSYVMPRHPVFSPFESGYVITLIELDEGPRFLSNVVGCAPEDVRFGMPVQVHFEDARNGFTVPLFRPAQATAVQP